MFEKFVNRYIIEGNLVATTAIHVGGADNAFHPSNNRKLFFRNAEGAPIIPGSSIKGMMRGFLEQLLASEVRESLFPNEWGCREEYRCWKIKEGQSKDDWDGQPQEIPDELKELLDRTDSKAAQELSEYLFGKNGSGGKLCLVCRVFGGQYNGAKLLVRDSKVKPETFYNEFEVRSGVSIDRDLGKSVSGRLYEIEVVPEGTEFEFCAILENVLKSEWECVKMILSAMELGMLSIGGMKSRGFGGMKLEGVTYQKVNVDNIKDYLMDKDIEKKMLSKAKEEV